MTKPLSLTYQSTVSNNGFSATLGLVPNLEASTNFPVGRLILNFPVTSAPPLTIDAGPYLIGGSLVGGIYTVPTTGKYLTALFLIGTFEGPLSDQPPVTVTLYRERSGQAQALMTFQASYVLISPMANDYYFTLNFSPTITAITGDRLYCQATFNVPVVIVNYSNFIVQQIGGHVPSPLIGLGQAKSCNLEPYCQAFKK